MTVSNIYSIILLVLASQTANAAYHVMKRPDRKKASIVHIGVICVASTIWSLGYAFTINAWSDGSAQISRIIGSMGTLVYHLLLINLLSERAVSKNKKHNIGLAVLFIIGIIIYVMTLEPGQTTYEFEEGYGMTFQYKISFANCAYLVYCTALIVLSVVFCLYIMKNNKYKKERRFASNFLVVAILLIIGNILDVFVPFMGKYPIPATCFAQFAGCMIIYRSFNSRVKSEVSVSNMAKYIYECMALPVLIYDVEEKLQISNDAASKFFGFKEMENGELETIALDELFDLEIKEGEKPFYFLNDRTHKELKGVCVRNKLNCTLDIDRIVDNYGDITGYLVFVADETERVENIKRLEEAKTQAEEAKIQAEAANQSKSTFLANMSHEIRTPMNAITGFAELLLKLDAGKEVHDYALDIKEAGTNLLAIINDILDISKLESGKAELVEKNYYPRRLFQDIYAIIGNQAKQKGLKFEMDINPDIPSTLYGDNVRLRGVLINLLNNAVKYTPSGYMGIRAKIKDKNEDQITLLFEVYDSGVGIKPEDKDVLFESFAQVDRRVHEGIEGTGLGLSIVKGNLELMNGSISIESEYGKGSTFYVEVTQKIIEDKGIGSFSVEHESRENRDSSISDVKYEGVRALIVDDSKINLRVAQNTMKQYGMDVMTATSGMEAIELCKTNSYDFVFMDQMMPQMNGIEAMKEIRKLGGIYSKDDHCKIIILTADAVSGVRERLMNEGFDEYLGKPINFKQLERLLANFTSDRDVIDK